MKVVGGGRERGDSRIWGGRAGSLLMVAPALIPIAVLFIYPMGSSLVSAFTGPDGFPSTANFQKVYALYRVDIAFTALITVSSTILIAIFSALIAGWLTLGTRPWAVKLLGSLYRWPLFIPSIVAAQCMRTFLAKNGLMNNALTGLGILSPVHTQSFLDWRGIIITFVWNQTPFATLLIAGALATLDRSMIEAARNLGASGLRILGELLLPQIAPTILVALVLSFVAMLSVLSVPSFVSSTQPTMITVDMAFRVHTYGDYGTANALAVVSYLMTGSVAWIYLRRGLKEGRA